MAKRPSLAGPLSLPDLIRMAGLALAYYVCGRWGLASAFVHPSVTAVWPPAGLALAALMVHGPKLWPGIFIGAFAVNMANGTAFFPSFGIASGNTLEALTGAYVVNRYARGLHAFDRVQDYFKFNILAGLGSTFISASIGIGCLLAAHGLSIPNAWTAWMTWWLGDAGGDIIWAPLLLLWTISPRERWTRSQWAEALLLFAAVVVSGRMAFQGWLPGDLKNYPLGFMRIPPLVWAAVRFGPLQAVFALAILSIIAVQGAVEGWRPSGVQTLSDSLLVIELYLEVIGVTVMALAIEARNRRKIENELTETHAGLELKVRDRTADLSQAVNRLEEEVTRRRETDRALQFSEKRFQRLVDSNIIGFMMVDLEGRILEANDTFLQLLGYTREDLQEGIVGGSPMTPPEYWSMDEWSRNHLKTAGYCPAFEKEYIRKDGSRIPVLVGVVLMEGPQPYSVCFVIDVTQRRLAQQALKKAYDDMELRVEERTIELSKANELLEREIKRRREVEDALRHLSMADVLTDLHNRRGFLVLAEQHLTLARRNRKKFVLFFADLDRLKEINDVLGHAEGDKALVEAADLLRRTFRESDIIARVGGDEFAIVATDAVDGNEAPYMERLQAQQRAINDRRDRKYQLSLSIGTSVFDPTTSLSIEELMAHADEDLYRHKPADRHAVLPQANIG